MPKSTIGKVQVIVCFILQSLFFSMIQYVYCCHDTAGSLASDIEIVHPGLDVCGTVAAVGSEVTTVAVGALVLVHGAMKRPFGGFAEYTIQDSATIVVLPDTLPDGVTPVTLASTPCAAWTAHRVLFDKLRIPRPASAGEAPCAANANLSLAIIGASGGVGSFAVQLARWAGVGRIIGICSTANVEYCRSLGVTDVIDYKSEGIYDGKSLSYGQYCCVFSSVVCRHSACHKWCGHRSAHRQCGL
jgi:NADPH:quinone reductase-like Zn-dependent oxidoreductase